MARLLAIKRYCLMLPLLVMGQPLLAHEIKDPNYGAVLFEFNQQRYFDALVAYEVIEAKGGVQNHGHYPDLLKGGMSLSFGLEEQAARLFEQLLSQELDEVSRNRAWFYLAKLMHQRGESEQAARVLANIHGDVDADIRNEYYYLKANLQLAAGDQGTLDALTEALDRDSVYAPYLYYNLGVNAAKQGDYRQALALLDRAVDYADDRDEMRLLADRAHLAAGQIELQRKRYEQAFAHFGQIHTAGVYSSRALLAYSWGVIGAGYFNQAIAPLQQLSRRAVSVPEVQEATAMLPSVYEQIGMPGLALRGFEEAVSRYEEGLSRIAQARMLLQQEGFVELFVGELVGDIDATDWFAPPPALQQNALSPFIMQWMADHSFQAVLKNLKDLYSLRNNLHLWQRKQRNFEVILAARKNTQRQQDVHARIERMAHILWAMQNDFSQLDRLVETIDDHKQKRRVLWMRDELEGRIQSMKAKLIGLKQADQYRALASNSQHDIDAISHRIETELQHTNQLIQAVEATMRRLIIAELEIHETRIKHYLVQSRLAMARLYDKALIAEMIGESTQERSAVSAAKEQGTDDAA